MLKERLLILMFRKVLNTITHHHSDLGAVLFGQVYQADITIQQVLQAAVKVPVGQDGFLQSVALGCCQTQLQVKKNRFVVMSCQTSAEILQQQQQQLSAN